MTRKTSHTRAVAFALAAFAALTGTVPVQSAELPAPWYSKAAPTDLVAIGAGSAHACVTRGDGTTLCWGQNRFNQLGPQSRETCGTSRVPCVKLPRTVVDDTGQPLTSALFSVGWTHNCALGKGTGEVRCLGDNRNGQTGDRTDPTPVPTQVSGKLWFSSLSAGVDSTCGVVAGELYCWGAIGAAFAANAAPPRPAQAAPAPVPGVTGARGALSTGKAHLCMDFGKAPLPEWMCLGRSNGGVFGIVPGVAGTTWEALPVYPWTLGINMSWAARENFSCVDLMGWQVECAGDNTYGQLGAGHANFTLDPQRVGGGMSLSAVAVGAAHACALDPYQQAWCWGAGTRGELGDGQAATSVHPVLVAAGALRFRALATGNGFSCGITIANQAHCWGASSQGQLGARFLDQVAFSASPVEVTFDPRP